MKIERNILVFPYSIHNEIIIEQLRFNTDYRQTIIKIIPDNYFITPYHVYSSKITQEDLTLLLKKYEDIFLSIKSLSLNLLFNIELDQYCSHFLSKEYSHLPLFIDYYGNFKEEEIKRIHSFVHRIDYNILIENEVIEDNSLLKNNFHYFNNFDYYINSSNNNQNNIYKSIIEKKNRITFLDPQYTNFNDRSSYNAQLDDESIGNVLQNHYQTPAIFIFEEGKFRVYLFGKDRFFATNITNQHIISSKELINKLHIYIMKFINKRVCSNCYMINQCLLNDWLLSQYEPIDEKSCVYKTIQS